MVPLPVPRVPSQRVEACCVACITYPSSFADDAAHLWWGKKDDTAPVELNMRVARACQGRIAPSAPSPRMAALRSTSRASDHGSFGGTPLCPPRRLIRCHRGSHRSGAPACQRHPPLHTCALPAPKNGATGAPLPYRMLHPSRGRYSDLCHTTVTPLS